LLNYDSNVVPPAELKFDTIFDEYIIKSMTEDFSELITYLDERFNKVEGDLRDLKESFVTLQTSVDKYAEKADAYFQEMLMLSQKIDRHEKWLHQLADKLGIKLSY
jgi:uncharacterized coiled-coil DUF342 family protein